MTNPPRTVEKKRCCMRVWQRKVRLQARMKDMRKLLRNPKRKGKLLKNPPLNSKIKKEQKRQKKERRRSRRRR